LKRKTRFTHREDLILVRYYQVFGCDWEAVSQFLPGRASNVVKNRFYSYIKKKKLLQSLINESKEVSSDIECGLSVLDEDSDEYQVENFESTEITQADFKFSEKESQSTAQSTSIETPTILPMSNQICLPSKTHESFFEYEDTGIYLDLTNTDYLLSYPEENNYCRDSYQAPQSQESFELNLLNWIGGNQLNNEDDSKYPPSPLLSDVEEEPSIPSHLEQNDALAHEILMFQNLVEELKSGLDQLQQNQMS